MVAPAVAQLPMGPVKLGMAAGAKVQGLNMVLRDARLSHDRIPALATAYKGAIHTILTSGLILVLAPWIMSLVISDPMIISILRSISAGALAAILLVLFALPATLVLTDRWVVPRTVHSQKP